MKKVSCFIIFIIISSCVSNNQNKKLTYEQARLTQFHSHLEQTIKYCYQQFDLNTETLKQKVKSQNDKEILAKVILLHDIKHNFFRIEKVFIKTMVALGKEEFSNGMTEFINSKEHPLGAGQFEKKLDAYSDFLQKRCSKYLPDTTFWSRRYLKQFKNTPLAKIPDFAHFYFDRLDNEAAILVLRTLQLAIAQEELAIQQKILEEK